MAIQATEGEYEYVHEFKERINEILFLQQFLFYLILNWDLLFLVESYLLLPTTLLTLS